MFTSAGISLNLEIGAWHHDRVSKNTETVVLWRPTGPKKLALVEASGSGYVTRFEVRKSFLDNYQVRQVGGQSILEYWTPAQALPALNASIVGQIELIAEYH